MTSIKDRQRDLAEFVAHGTEKCRVLVVGDVMLDQYYYGEVTRISPEAPVPITRVIKIKETLGGAANVAHNLALLGCQTEVAASIGADHHGGRLRALFEKRGISIYGLVVTGAPTTTKLRVIGGHQQMMRLDFEETEPVTGEDAERIIMVAQASLADGAGALVLSDYGKGIVTPELCARLIEAAHHRGVPVVVDPKGNDWEKYRGADYITPNLKELNAVQPSPVKNDDAAVERAARYALERFGICAMVATRSESGLSLITANEAVHIPTKAQEVFDVSGAGDTVIAAFALAMAGGLPPDRGAYLANLAASVVVAKVGTYAVSRDELFAVLEREGVHEP
ncbi:MAG: D-glycero-beta-D-manno-heptose-7-phosphate kinase [Schwartzia sp.]|nr:D-glycero-beta-D-manno-heptose-7-phosphate kinase [Schwartzia sp. (in: firmicutes)]MBO6237042.1 D-glycero-beta-D-manno-heptose-7-phosphate kinase [Schwartzia sp. (in: firmicutes)]